MPLTISQLLDALPDHEQLQTSHDSSLHRPLREATMRPVPIGRWRRLSLLSSLQAKIAAAYAFYWVRSWFQAADANEKQLAETHLRNAVRVLDSMIDWSQITDEAAAPMKLLDEFAEWCWGSRYCGGEFDFGDEQNFRRGYELFMQLARTRFVRTRPCTATMNRQQFGLASILYQLRARFDVRELAEQEVVATGWDRSGYVS